MKAPVPTLVISASLIFVPPLLAQTSGVAHPEAIDDSITTTSATVHHSSAPQSAAAPVVHEYTTDTLVVVTPAAPPRMAAPQARPQPETAQMVRPLLQPPPVDPADAGIVTTYPYAANSLMEGTLLKARLNEKLSSVSSRAGTRFTALLSDNIEHGGKVVLPAGSVLSGRITSVRGGRRIAGAAAIHIEPNTLTLPDGTFYRIAARVVDLDQFHNSHVNSEGTILRSDHPKATLAALSLTTGSAAAAGAVLAGGAGAVVGAGIGAGVGAIWWLKQDRQETLPAGTEIVFSLNTPLELTPAIK